MSAVQLDALAACADEPIRVPGAVQPHGVLLAVDETGLRVVVASQNAPALFGREVLGLPLGELLSADEVAAVRDGLGRDLVEVNPLPVRVGGHDVDLVLHRADGLLLAELEPVPGPSARGLDRRLPAVLQRLSGAETLEQLTAMLARDVRDLTGFDRVMVYRFDEEWNGEVVAEERRDDLDPFLGLRYPSSDIPPQARELYATNWLRLIPDTAYVPVPLSPTPLPLDLSGSVLRSVSPVHLEYLANMGVAASMSVSLLDRGRLWGLVACHHYAGPHRPPYVDRAAAEFLARTASLLLHTKVEEGARQGVVGTAQRGAALAAAVGRDPRAALAALTEGDSTVLDLLPAAGAAVRLGGRLRLLGTTPPPERVVPLVTGLLATGRSSSSALSSVVDAGDVTDTASGLLAAEVGRGTGDFLAWFRPETVREVAWAGDPRTSKVVEGSGGPRLSPRRSFALYSETVRGTSSRWLPHEEATAVELAGHVAEAALARALQDDRLTATLQRTLLLEELPAVPGLALAARYRPSSSDVVGGDWYDLVLLPGGRLAMVLGDVAGHGLAAAAVTAQLRHALRAHLLRDRGPGAALESLNALVGALLPGEMATVVLVELDPASGDVRLASAGHLPALHRSPDATRAVDDGRGPALGLLDASTFPEARLRLGPQDRLLLYSDGLVERRGADLQSGLDRLCDAVSASPVAPEHLLDGVLEALNPPDGDDVTLLAVGLSTD